MPTQPIQSASCAPKSGRHTPYDTQLADATARPASEDVKPTQQSPGDLLSADLTLSEAQTSCVSAKKTAYRGPEARWRAAVFFTYTRESAEWGQMSATQSKRSLAPRNFCRPIM